jgi:hypothetical protein
MHDHKNRLSWGPIHAQWRHPVVRHIPIDVHNMVWRTGPGLVSYGLWWKRSDGEQ